MAHEGTELDARTTTIRVRSASLSVIEGPDTGASMRVSAPTMVVGSGETADLRLSDTTVSREHLRVTLLEDGLRLRDECSKNGTWIGSLRTADAILTEDVVVRLGSTMISIQLDAEASEVEVSATTTFGPAIGTSPAMRYVFATLTRAAATEATILLEGESGVGKDVLAQAIHQHSPRASGPFVAVDCGSIPANLVETELFGHARGAFTGATKDRAGMFVEAQGGTIFLDEIGELALEHQTRLLRVLEAREVRPVGASAAEPIDVRVVAATNRNLNELVRQGAFRGDLYYRLAVVSVRVPPLRDRPEDVLLLAARFLKEITRGASAELPRDLAGMLVTYPWPGNVRELRNVVQRYAVLGYDDSLFESGGVRATAAPSTTLPEGMDDLSFHDARRAIMDRFERAYLVKVLEKAHGVVSHAAAQSGLARQSFHRMMKRLDLTASDDAD